MGMEEMIRELNNLKAKIPRQTYRTIMGQIHAGDVNGAAVGICRLKEKLAREAGSNGEQKIVGD